MSYSLKRELYDWIQNEWPRALKSLWRLIAPCNDGKLSLYNDQRQELLVQLHASETAITVLYKYINPIRAKFFRGNIKHIFAFYVIRPHWYDTDDWILPQIGPGTRFTTDFLPAI